MLNLKLSLRKIFRLTTVSCGGEDKSHMALGRLSRSRPMPNNIHSNRRNKFVLYELRAFKSSRAEKLIMRIASGWRVFFASLYDKAEKQKKHARWSAAIIMNGSGQLFVPLNNSEQDKYLFSTCDDFGDGKIRFSEPKRKSRNCSVEYDPCHGLQQR